MPRAQYKVCVLDKDFSVSKSNSFSQTAKKQLFYLVLWQIYLSSVLYASDVILYVTGVCKCSSTRIQKVWPVLQRSAFYFLDFFYNGSMCTFLHLLEEISLCEFTFYFTLNVVYNKSLSMDGINNNVLVAWVALIFDAWSYGTLLSAW